MTRVCAAFVLLAATSSAASPPPLGFAEVVAARRPSPAEAEARALLAEARRAAAGGASRVAEAPSVSVLGGPRRSEDGEAQADLGVAFELPLLHGRGSRGELAAAIERVSAALVAGSGAVAAADLAAAFVDAWLAQSSVEVREQDLAAAEEWLTAARRRVEAGADPPYEPTLVAGERDRALLELVAVRRELELAWGELAARAGVGPAPRPVALAGLPAAPAAASAEDGVAAASIAAREELALGLARVRGSGARSRWALASEVATEGDERLAHVGVLYRLPLRGERAAIDQEQAAAEARAKRQAEGERAGLRARLAAAQAALRAVSPALDAADLLRAQQALTARLAEGKERPSEVLPLRRQLLEARLAGLAARAAQAKAAAELHYLLGGPPDAP
jgi:multidrug efflux system outer membrane protein